MHVSFVAGAMLFIDDDVLAQLAAALPSSETVERRAGPDPATHGGRISLVFASFLFFHLCLFDVINAGDFIFIDAGCGIGQLCVYAALLSVGASVLSLGIDINDERIDDAINLRNAFNLQQNIVQFLLRDFIFVYHAATAGRPLDRYERALLGTIPGKLQMKVFMFVDNAEGIFDYTSTNRRSSTQTLFTQSIEQHNLFPIGSIIISLSPLQLNPGGWRCNTFTTNLPHDCLDWHQQPAANVSIYKYEKFSIYVERRMRTRHANNPRRILFCNYLKDQTPDNFCSDSS